MKRRTLFTLLAVMLAIIILQIFSTKNSGTEFNLTNEDNHSHNGIVFTKMESISSSGSFFLDDDLTLDSDLSIAENTNLSLCLNGHVLNLNNHQIINHGTLKIYSCDTEITHYFNDTNINNRFWVWSNSEEPTHLPCYGGVITGGYGNKGGAIFNEGTSSYLASLDVNNVSFIGNVGGTGAAIYSNEYSTLALDNVDISHNASARNGDFNYLGNSALYTLGVTNLYNVKVNNNVNEDASVYISSADVTIGGLISIEMNVKRNDDLAELLLGNNTILKIADTGLDSNSKIYVNLESNPTKLDDNINITSIANSNYQNCFIPTASKDYKIRVVQIDGKYQLTYGMIRYVQYILPEGVVGNAPLDTKEYYLGDTYQVMGNNTGFYKTGYTFIGFKNLTDEKVYKPGDEAEFTTEVVYEAVFEANTYNVYYYKDQTDFENGIVLKNDTYTYGTIYQFTESTIDGMIFDGWYYKNSTEEVTALSASSLDDVTVIGKWVVAHTDDDITYTKRLLKGMSNPNGTYLLTRDLVLDSDLTISSTSSVAICLNGYNIDLNGHSIINNGLLRIDDCNTNVSYYQIDSNHKWIKSSKYEEYHTIGGAIINGSNNYAIINNTGSFLTLGSVDIVGNLAGGVLNNGSLTITKAVIITNNFKNNILCNVYLDTNKKIIVDKLTGEAKLGVYTKAKPTKDNLVTISDEIDRDISSVIISDEEIDYTIYYRNNSLALGIREAYVDILVEPSIDKPLVYGYTSSNPLVVIAEKKKANGDNPLLYQWYSCSDIGKNDSKAIDGATSNSFDIPLGLTPDFYYYYVVVSFVDGETGLKTNASKVAIVEVKRIPYDLSNLSFEDDEVTYDGLEHTIVSTGTLPQGLSVSYSGSAVNASSTTITMSFTNSNEFYETPEDWKATLTILPLDIEGSTIVLKDFNTYSQKPMAQEVLSAKINGLDITYDLENNIETDAGSYTLTVKGNGNFKGSKDLAFSILKLDISNATVTLGDKLVYNGEAQTQSIEGVMIDDIVVTYIASNDNGTDAKKYTMTLEGTNNFCGSVNKDFLVYPLDISNCNVELDNELTYNGKSQAQTIKSIIINNLQATYEVSDNININAGEYTLSVDGTNNFTGNIKKNYTIKKYDVAAIWSDVRYTYNGNTQSISVSYRDIDDIKVDLSATTEELFKNAGSYIATAVFKNNEINYNILENKTKEIIMDKAIYDMSKVDFVDQILTYNGERQNISIAGILPTGLDGITVGVEYSDGRINVGSTTITASFTTTSTNYYLPEALTADLEIIPLDIKKGTVELKDKLTYTGSLLTQEVSKVILDNYTVTYDVTNNTAADAGIYRLKVTGTGNFTGEITQSFTVAKKTVEIDWVLKEYSYNGQIQQILASFKNVNDEVVNLNVTTVNEFKNAGTYLATAQFTKEENNYQLPKNASMEYVINKIDYDISSITYLDYEVDYDGESHNISVNGTLPVGLDNIGLEAVYSESKVNAGVYPLTVSFKSVSTNYNIPSSLTANLTIKALDIKDAVVDLDNELIYNGVLQAQLIKKVTLNYLAVSYDISNNENVDAGSYTLTITGNGNFTGTKEVDYTISPFTASIIWSNNDYTYNGNVQEVKATFINALGVEEELVLLCDSEFKNANDYKFTIEYSNKNYALIGQLDNTYTIKKADYDLSNVKFNDKTVLYDGSYKTIRINENLPIGLDYSRLDVEYQGGLTEPGITTVYAIFKTSSVNYNVPERLAAKLTILAISLNANDIEISTAAGINPLVKLEANKIDLSNNEPSLDYSSYLSRFDYIDALYDIKLKDTNDSVYSYNKDIIIKIKVSDDFKLEGLKLVHGHSNDDITVLELSDSLELNTYRLKDGYLYIHVNKLSEFAFIYEKPCYTQYIIIGITVLFIGLSLVNILVIKKKKLTIIINSVDIVGVLGFIVMMHCALCIVFSIINIILIILSFGYLLYNRRNEASNLKTNIE